MQRPAEGQYVHADKFFSAVDGGIGFSVFGTDLNDRPYEEGYASGRRLGFPDATVQLDLSTFRRVPWDGDVPFFLGDFVQPESNRHASPAARHAGMRKKFGIKRFIVKRFGSNAMDKRDR